LRVRHGCTHGRVAGIFNMLPADDLPSEAPDMGPDSGWL